MELTISYIDSLAPNSSAISNGKALVKNNSFTKLQITQDKTLLFGECSGSGKKPYICSMDFIDAAVPVPRCSCPSRQIPCKHVLGLMYAYAEGQPFVQGELPEDILEKRAGATKRAENKEKKKQESKEKKADQANAKPSKAKITAAIKKINMQLEGIETAQMLLRNIIQTGLAGLDARTKTALQTQITALGNYHIKGIQTAFNDLLLHLKETDANYEAGIERLIYLQVLIKKAREHLTSKKEHEDKALELDISTEIEEQIGHVWKLEELYTVGCYLENVDIVQLSFNVVDDKAKKEFIDTGFFICLQNGKIYTAKNYRPYKSVKYINRADTVFDKVFAEELYIYPGGMNPRIRYDRYIMEPIEPKVYTSIKSFAADDFIEMAKAVKNQIKTPLADKNPTALLKISAISKVCDSNGQSYVQIQDSKGTKQLLSGGAIDMLCLIDFNLLVNHALLVTYENNYETGLLTARPLSVITDTGIIRLEY